MVTLKKSLTTRSVDGKLSDLLTRDLDDYGKWGPLTSGLTLADGDGLRRDAPIEANVSLGLTRATMKGEVNAFVEGRRWGFRFRKARVISVLVNWQLEKSRKAEDEDKVHLTVDYEIGVPVVGWLAERLLIAPWARRSMDTTMRNLQKHLESAPTSAS